MGIQVPERAQMIRRHLLEERLYLHLAQPRPGSLLYWLRLRPYAVLPRETLHEMVILTGARKTYYLNLIGGSGRDLLKDDMIQTCQAKCNKCVEAQELWMCCAEYAEYGTAHCRHWSFDPEIARDLV